MLQLHCAWPSMVMMLFVHAEDIVLAVKKFHPHMVIVWLNGGFPDASYIWTHFVMLYDS